MIGCDLHYSRLLMDLMQKNGSNNSYNAHMFLG